MLRSTIRRFAPRSSRREDLIFTDMYGFTPIRKRRIDDLHIVAYEFEHVATGAQYYHLDVDDNNNTFCIGFRTPALNSKGTSHVLEHTTLCGSHKYPVRDPFFMMLKRSLSSFMNAMTGSDYTLYPFSTTNEKDFENLLDVYLDAVFHPLLREEDFKQEGHRVELEDKSADAAEEFESGRRMRRLVHNGVVFNEMRGVVSDPNNCFVRSLMRTMLPDTHYVHHSGGYPPDILKLSYVELLYFQKRHYHPSNSITFTYGNQHPQRHMEALGSYFKTFTRAQRVEVPTLTQEHRFKEPQVVQLCGPLDAMGNPKRQKRVAVSYGVPEESNKLEDIVALSVLDSLLSSGPSSPMYKSLIESHIGSKYTPMKGYAFYLSSPIVTYGVAGVDEERADAEGEVLQAVESALRTVQTDGFDERRVRSVIFQEELQHRHRSADYGLNTCTGLCAMGLCRAQNNPLDFINWLPQLHRLAEDNAASLLPRIESHMLRNSHRAVVSVSAKRDYLNKLQEQLKEAEEEVNAAATEADKAYIEGETKEWLARLRAPQPQDVLPTLRISDIPPESFAEPLPRRTRLSTSNDDEVYIITYPTNGLVYVHGLIPFHASLTDAVVHGDLEKVPQNLMFVQSLIGQTGAGALSYKDHSIAAELACSGFGFTPLLNESYLHRGTTITGTAYGFYTTKEKLKEALELLSVTLLEPRVSADDADVYTRALSNMKMACSTAIQSLQGEGNRYAVTRAVAELTLRGQLREHWYGLAQSTHASEMLEKLQGGTEECESAVRTLLEDYAVFTREMAADMSRSVMWATCEGAHRKEVETLLKEFLDRFPNRSSKAETHLYLPTREVKPGLHRIDKQLPIDTSFVGFALPNKLSWDHPDQARVRVAVLLLCNEYLHRRVREEGGAYGSNCAATLHGEVGGISMSSYRDPSPELTAKAFLEAGDWLCKKNITAAGVNEAKLRLFASIDSPYAADSYGEAYFYNDVRQPTKQLMRDALLSVTPQDVIDVAHYFKPEGKPTVVSVLQPMGGSKAEAATAQS
ncbi:pitrilysin-like metalloprotease metallo-peptidase Clan ME Family M16C [Leptomonas seymouri]|uniref:Pitrilysin-like metalloprotease metallo-peptidase Clan ME Family M16C n=1 Tax=Leptomonas seymouri TaxID=5684 RepID=A0A0N1I980_LEPSE|nr:pitrilysin-like metalloprotease metallo-peptidase Clan ME Family M16C [Leptomonas seymouri]|eukprot:KPI88458.1 pitrilysin-like metalloprotease metallo-peptidase Clan ME Family M16C [Leptomonas seymouri]